MPEKSFPVFRAGRCRFAAGSLGEDHPETVQALHNLAMAYQDAGRLDQAIVLLERTLARRKASRIRDPSELIESMNDLAVAYWESGQPARAIPLYEAALEKYARGLGDDHADTLTIIDNLAVAYAAAGQAGRAISLHETVLSRAAGQAGRGSSHHAGHDEQPGAGYRGWPPARRVDRALREDRAELRAKLSDDHPTVLTAMCGLARAYQSERPAFAGDRLVRSRRWRSAEPSWATSTRIP